jgi:ethanolamine permease
VTLYIISMTALFALRRREPDLLRPYLTPLYPLLPTVAMLLAALALLMMLYGNYNLAGADNLFERWLSVWYVAILAVAMLYYYVIVRRRLTAADRAQFGRVA